MPIQYFMLFYVSILTLFAFLSMLYYFLISKLLYNLAIASLAKGNWLNNKEKRRKKTKKEEKFKINISIWSMVSAAYWLHGNTINNSGFHIELSSLFFSELFSLLLNKTLYIFTKLKREKKRPAINCKLQLTRSKSKWENQLNYHAFSLTKKPALIPNHPVNCQTIEFVKFHFSIKSSLTGIVFFLNKMSWYQI